MHLQATDPEVRTLIDRINREEIDLQPEFQRAAVWNTPKQQRLIDSILRDWHIPPIHLVDVGDGSLEVLDGQQRLQSILNFSNDGFPVDGLIDPSNDEIQELDGLLYSQLPSTWQRRFDRFGIRQFVLTNYEPEEPYELFYRLNQSVTLTAPEQRNAFYGSTRDQVQDLAYYARRSGWSRQTIGFDNTRMAYQDVIARSCYAIQRGTLSEKISSSDLASWFRDDAPISQRTTRLAKYAIRSICKAATTSSLTAKLNKASAFTWMIAFARVANLPNPQVCTSKLAPTFALLVDRKTTKGDRSDTGLSASHAREAQSIFFDRASSRVADVNSVLLRDAIIWTLTPPSGFPPKIQKQIKYFRKTFEQSRPANREDTMVEALLSTEWDKIP